MGNGIGTSPTDTQPVPFPEEFVELRQKPHEPTPLGDDGVVVMLAHGITPTWLGPRD
jgi:hypothetical protein